MEETIHIDPYYSSLAGMLDKYERYSRKDLFLGNNIDDFLAWQDSTRDMLWNMLGLQYMDNCELEPILEESVEVDKNILRKKIRIQVEPGVWMPMYILIPTNKTQKNIFIAPPGHQGAGKYSVAGCREIPAVAKQIDFFNYDYGLQLAKKGYITICPDARGFGERRDKDLQNDTKEAFLNSSCYQLSHMAEAMGETVIGMCTWDLMRLVDYIKSQKEWNSYKIGCLGFSGGGMQTLWLSALDKRVEMAVISGYMYGYRDSHLILNGNCSCNYVPNLWRHFDMGDIGSLIAPRPLIIQSCKDDHLNGPRGLENVYEQMQIIKNAYTLLKKEKNLYHDICPGEHRWHEEHMDEAFKYVGEGE